MPNQLLTPALAAGLWFCCAVAADAKPVYSTKYNYYPVSGATASEVYNTMIRRGPHVNGAKAYASTSATSSQEGKLAQGKTCHIENYRLKIDFVIRLPRIKNDKALSGPVKARWQEFEQFLKKHEETHRSIWLGCASALEAQIHAINDADCSAADAKASKLWSQMRQACVRKHDAFDLAEQKRLLKQPFVRLVLSRQSSDTAAAAVPPKKKRKKKSG